MLASGGGDSEILVWDLTGRMKDGRIIPVRLNPQFLESTWQDLGGGDGFKALNAIWALVDAPAETVPFLRQRLRPVRGPSEQRLQQLLRSLDDDQFAVREHAAKELADFGELVKPALEKHVATNPGLQARRTLEDLLERADNPFGTPGRLGALRAVEVLEQIGTRDARALLEELAQNTSPVRLKQEAKASLERLAKGRGPVP
jgi:hypothetical protein